MPKAFTLIELLVVISIIGLLSSIILINYGGQKQKDLEEQAVLQFVSDLRRAQNMAMSVVDCKGIKTKYGIDIKTTKTYRVTCDLQDTKLEVQITGNNIYFLPIDKEHPTLRAQGGPVTIETKQITISPEGKITYE